MTRKMACHPAMLCSVAYSVERHLIDSDLAEKMSIASITELTNREWRGCGNSELFGPSAVRKALLELQAMELLQFDFIVDMNSYISLLKSPLQRSIEEMDELVRYVFYGSMGTYSNPVPYRYMTWVHPWVRPDSESVRTMEIDDFVGHCTPIGSNLVSREKMLKILRELRLMRAINFIYEDPIVTFRSSTPSWVSERNYLDTFGFEAE